MFLILQVNIQTFCIPGLINKKFYVNFKYLYLIYECSNNNVLKNKCIFIFNGQVFKQVDGIFISII